MNPDKLKELQIAPEQKRRPAGTIWIIGLGVLVITLLAVFVAVPRAKDRERVVNTGMSRPTNSGLVEVRDPGRSAAGTGEVVLTVSGYIVNHERIEISPRFLGVVKWIGVKKGDSVTNGQVVVLLDDTEYKARLREAEGRLGSAKATVTRAQLDYERVTQLIENNIESRKAQDDARLQLESARALLQESEGSYELVKTYLSWTVIRSPIDGVVLEKLVDPNELVVPQSFGGPRGPSTALIAVADTKDLQVEIELNEIDLSKISLNQQCRVSPEAYLQKHYDGFVAEIAPEANRSKGTLQIKVQIRNPDRFLTPELSAKVEFLRP